MGADTPAKVTRAKRISDRVRDEFASAGILNDMTEGLVAEVEEIGEYEQIFDLQWTRMGEATEVWRKANPGNDLVMPDLGKLLEWLLERVRRYDVIQNWYDTTHGDRFDHDHHCPWPNGDCTCGWEAAKQVLEVTE